LQRIIFLFLQFICVSGLLGQNVGRIPDPNPKRLKSEITKFKEYDRKNAPPENAILFLGGSAIFHWNTYNAFEDLPILNRGIISEEIPDMIYYFDTIVKPYSPSVIVLYCGDDFLWIQSSYTIFRHFREFRKLLSDQLPETTLVYMAANMSASRWATDPRIPKLNDTVQSMCRNDKKMIYVDTESPLLNKDGVLDYYLFNSDHKQLNAEGYMKWEAALEPVLRLEYKRLYDLYQSQGPEALIKELEDKK